MTLRNPSRVSFPAVSAALAFALAFAGGASASAGTLKGSVKLPESSRSTRLYQGYWRLENGNVPVQNSGGAKLETAVVLQNVNGAHPPPARTVTVEIGGLDAHPRMVITGPGSVIEIKNTGKVRLDLSTPETPSVMPLEQLPPGATRRARFDAIGGYAVHDSEYPHIMISVHLKVWARGRWAAEQEVEAGSKEELIVKVAAPGQKGSEKEAEKEAAE